MNQTSGSYFSSSSSFGSPATVTDNNRIFSAAIAPAPIINDGNAESGGQGRGGVAIKQDPAGYFAR